MRVARVKKRQIDFCARTRTSIWQEESCPENPYLARLQRCHGFDLGELARKRSFVDILHLLFLGELPDHKRAKTLELLMILFINPGPRHPATRAAMNAAVSRANPAHLLPIGLSVLGGKHLGGEEVTASMRFLLQHAGSEPQSLVASLVAQIPEKHQGDFHPAPGFGSRFGGIDPLPGQAVDSLREFSEENGCLAWGSGFVEALRPHGMGWLMPGVAAAVFCDLGLPPRAGAGLFQLISAPGLLAHALELADKPISAMPFLDEKHFRIAQSARKSHE